MTRETKIALGVFLIFFIYALTSFFQLGVFLTFFFFDDLTLVLVALFFLFINRKKKSWPMLLLATFAFSGRALMDVFTVHYLSNRFQLQFIEHWSENIVFIWCTFIFFIGFLLISLGLLKPHLPKRLTWLIFPLFSLLLFSIAMVIINQSIYFDIGINIFFLAYYIIAIRSDHSEDEILIPLASLFLLHALLAGFKYIPI